MLCDNYNKNRAVWRGGVLVTLVIGMMAMVRGAWAFSWGLGSWIISCSYVTEIPQIECEALVALYDSTGGDNWTRNTGWKDTNTLCSFFLPTCLTNNA